MDFIKQKNINKKIYTIKNHAGIKYIRYILYKSGLVVRDKYDEIEFEADSIITINKINIYIVGRRRWVY